MEEQIEDRDDKDKDYDLPDEGCFQLFIKSTVLLLLVSSTFYASHCALVFT